MLLSFSFHSQNGQQTEISLEPCKYLHLTQVMVSRLNLLKLTITRAKIYTPHFTDTCCPNVFLEADNLLSSDVLLSFPLEHVKVILLLQPPAWVRPILIMRPGKTPQQGFVKIHPIAGLGIFRHLPMFLSTYQVRNPKGKSKN